MLWGLLALSLVGCKGEVDPAYKKQIEDAALAMCKCGEQADKDAANTCMDAKYRELNPKAPNGQAPGLYEEGLKDADRQFLIDVRNIGIDCQMKLAAATAPDPSDPLAP